METISPPLKFVVARHKEDVGWTRDHDCRVITKDEDIPNVGREASSYLYYIVSHYHELEGEYVFCQGHPFDHVPNFFAQIRENRYVGTLFTCDAEGCPNECGLPIHEISILLGLPLREKYEFKNSAQFRINAGQIRARSLEWYTKALIISVTNPKAAWVFERLWPLIFDLDTSPTQ
jgi:hypothetical protein